MAHLLASAVLAGFSTVRHLSPVVADEATTTFRSPKYPLTLDFIDAGYRVQRFSRDHTIRSTEVMRKLRRDIMLPYRRGNFKHKGAYFRVEAHYLLAISVKVDEIVGSVKINDDNIPRMNCIESLIDANTYIAITVHSGHGGQSTVTRCKTTDRVCSSFFDSSVDNRRQAASKIAKPSSLPRILAIFANWIILTIDNHRLHPWLRPLSSNNDGPRSGARSSIKALHKYEKESPESTMRVNGHSEQSARQEMEYIYLRKTLVADMSACRVHVTRLACWNSRCSRLRFSFDNIGRKK
ncbi:hypothetical protein EAG_12284 [Camponotus floridanus]|uniref:Uncharacterized protein n=1 Tax=Camponotus floridanus TaxID=104421 RepID=E2AWK7_CAMFO|nr:hypothetical protein EAG_12284 [Camponotus floridanus]